MTNARSFGGALTADDFVAAQTLHMRKWRKRQYAVFVFIGILGGSLAWYGATMAGMIGIGASIGGLAGLFALHTRRLPGTWKRLFEQQKSLHERFSYSWDDSGLHVVTALGQARRPWSHFTGLDEDAHTILLYHSDAMFELIPKRWFAEAAVLDLLRAEISRHPFANRK